MFTNVNYDRGLFTALDETKRKIYITESISFIFTVKATKKTARYTPVTYKDPEILSEVEAYLKNNEYNPEVLKSIVIRFGWMDKRLNKLEFIGLEDLVSKIRSKDATPTQIRKLTAICKQLSISLSSIVK